MKLGPIDSDGRTIVNGCDSCGGDHETMLKPVNEKLRANTGNTHWFECPHHNEGGPIMVVIDEPKQKDEVDA